MEITAFPSDLRIFEPESQGSFQQSQTFKEWDKLIPSLPLSTLAHKLSAALPEGSNKSLSLNLKNLSDVMFTGQTFATQNGRTLIDIHFSLNLFKDSLHISKARSNPFGSPANMREVFKALVDSACLIPVGKIALEASRVGGYAWAKFGFTPRDSQEWKKLSESIFTNRLPNLKPLLSDEIFSAVETILKNPDPKSIWALADLSDEITLPEDSFVFPGLKVPLGKALLVRTFWYAELDLKDKDAMQKLNDYVLKSPRKHVSEDIKKATSEFYFK